ncbi:MAG: hypothetical protein A4E53_00434 [Pelotomaculum sp. PtaB.Bin104]|nr:MAG: hypothetical protein A4E53_00434 [Pelotomaculum sp. PtaB.Bin104]
MKKIRKLAVLCAVLALMLSFTTVAYAGGGEEIPEETENMTATGGVMDETEDATIFTPDGTDTVVDSATDEDGKQFYTITTPAGNTFYLIIDLERDSDNVYFLDAVMEKDLLALAESDDDTEESDTDNAVTSTTEPETTTEATAITETSEDTTEQASTETQDNNMGMLLLVLAVVLIGGGAGYYFKIYRPKHQGTESEDDFDYGDESNLCDTEEAEQDDELPPWEDGGNGDDEA